jgi:hypothetical protein
MLILFLDVNIKLLPVKLNVSGRLGDSLIGNQRLTAIMLCDYVCP